MKLILPYFIILIVLLQLCLKKNSKKTEKNNDDFWRKEYDPNSVRKKDISGLDYITIPDTLTIPDTQNPRILKEWNTLCNLKDKKILNLTGYTNTDLKLQYGAANLTQLTVCDNNFTALAKAVARIGEQLMKDGFTDEALSFLEYGITIRTDVSTNYTVLAEYYRNEGMPEKIDTLISRAEQLKSLMKDSILSKLKEIRSN